MNSRTCYITFMVLCALLSFCFISVQTIYAGDDIKIDESTNHDFFELQTTVMEVHQKDNYLIAGEKVIQLLDFRTGRKRFITMLRNTDGEKILLKTFARGQKIFIRGFKLSDGTIKARGIYQLPETVVTSEDLRKLSFVVTVPVWEPILVK